MKTPNVLLSCKLGSRSGFALVITLSLMILLTIIAVGLLSLSTISLRTSVQSNAMAEARANAKLAMMLAIGDLQKYAGPDVRVTANAEVSATPVENGKLAGVWRSDQIEIGVLPEASDYSPTNRNDQFLAWLTSSPGGIENKQLNFAAIKPKVDAIDLWNDGTLGPAAARTNPQNDRVTASKVLIEKTKGRFAYAVIDEGVKARIDTPYSPAPPNNDRTAQVAEMGSGQRPNVSGMLGLEQLTREKYTPGNADYEIIKKGITHDTQLLAAETIAAGASDALKLLYHDVTTKSKSVLADVARGGLKRDLNLLANSNVLPTELAGQKVYQSMLGITGLSDPTWGSLHEISRIYRDQTKMSTDGASPVLLSGIPNGWQAFEPAPNPQALGEMFRPAGIPTTNPPQGVVLMPTIAKVDVVLNLVVRDMFKQPTSGAYIDEPHNIEAVTHFEFENRAFRGSDVNHLLHFVYSPMVTLHNPYNVALEFSEFEVVFCNVPIAIRVIRNGIAQSKFLVPFDAMFTNKGTNALLKGTQNWNKRFAMKLQSAPGPSANTTLRLLPGEVKLFSPYITPTLTWRSDWDSATREFVDFESGRNSGNVNTTITTRMKGVPGYNGEGLGFDGLQFAPRIISDESSGFGNSIHLTEPTTVPEPRPIANNPTYMNRDGVIPVRLTDTLAVEFAPLNAPHLCNNIYTVEIYSKKTPTSPRESSGIIQLDYGTPKGLAKAILGSDNATLKAPDPSVGTTDTWIAGSLYEWQHTPVSAYTRIQPFAMVSAHTKTTAGGADLNGKNGRNFAKPWAFSHPAGASSINRLPTNTRIGHSSWGSHEVNLVRIDDGVKVDSGQQGTAYALTGLTTSSGVKSGVLYDIPLTPLQSLTNLNSANPGGFSSSQPRFANPIGNSWAHPLMDPAKVLQPSPNPTDGTLLDHSFLLNRALYDSFYFSGLGTRNGISMTGNNTVQLTDNFIAGQPLSDPRLKLYNPDNEPSDTLKNGTGNLEFYKSVAAWQMLDGGFNINSTSKTAWKAMLASGNSTSTLILGLNAANTAAALNTIRAPNYKNNETRISRFRIPNSPPLSIATTSDEVNRANWLAPRDYTDAELDSVATEIVKQVKLRGPFLSLSDFVNRKLGTGADAQKGALQQAIDDSQVNNSLASSLGQVNIAAGSVSNYNYANPTAAAGSSMQGIPGFLTQADIMTVLGNAATPRSDTFTIRGYGEARDAGGNNITAKALCEVVVQRVPDYIDPVDQAGVEPFNLTSKINQDFGRKFIMVSFRWLNENEI